MRILNRSEIILTEAKARQDFAVPMLLLMEQAGFMVAQRIIKLLKSTDRTKLVFVCGTGNNGGDGLAAARHCQAYGADISVYMNGKSNTATDLTQIYSLMLEKTGVEIRDLGDAAVFSDFARETKDCDIIVDALAGIGFMPPMKEDMRKIISAINQSECPVISIDIPSGVDCDTGQALLAVEADETVVLIASKPAHYLYPGASYCGMLTYSLLSLPDGILKNGSLFESIDMDTAVSLFELRSKDSHKSDYGKTLIIAGSAHLPGAAILAAKGAIRAGAGLVYLAELDWVAGSCLPPEVLLLKTSQSKNSTIKAEHIRNAAEEIGGFSSLVMGPGLSRDPIVLEMVRKTAENWPSPVVLDAEALNAYVGKTDDLRKIKSYLTITPHPGEMARLTGLSIEEVQKDRIKVAKEASDAWFCTVVLKGAGTVVAHPTGDAFINTSGNPGMAAGGSGDVLAGLVGGLVSQGYPVETASTLAVYVHGAAGDLAEKVMGPMGYTPSDLAERIPTVFRYLKERKVEGKHGLFAENR